MTETADPPERSQITDFAELLYRQVHRIHWHDDRPSSQTFAVRSNDEGLLSVDRGSRVDAVGSYRRAIGCKVDSVAVVAVTVAEIDGFRLRALEDPIVEPCENPDHAVIDFRNQAASAQRKIGSKLTGVAMERGILHRNDGS